MIIMHGGDDCYLLQTMLSSQPSGAFMPIRNSALAATLERPKLPSFIT